MTTFNVSNGAGLSSAISSAQAGDTIILAAGNYGNVKIANRSFTAPVTIMSASGADMAHFDRLALENVTNVTLKQIDIGGGLQAGETASFVATVNNSRNVTLDGLHVHGTMDNDPTSDLSGISVRGGSNGIKIVNTEFEQLFRGVWVQRSQNIQLADNYVHDIRCDGFALSAVKNVLIEGNKFTNFHRQPDDHSDAIQFWSTNETTASTDITIRNNQILQGSGTAMQGIFMRDETNVLPYERVLIENNLLYESGYANGFTVIGGKTITMRQNTAISSTRDSVANTIRIENVAGAVISKNLVDMFAQFGTNSGISFDGNIALKSSPSYVSLLTSINSGSTATIEGLLLDGVGYQLTTATEEPVVAAAVVVDGTAPSAAGGATDVTTAVATHSATVTYSDTGSGVDASSIGTDDLSIAGPGGVTVQSASAVTNSDGSVTATYVLASPSGFASADNGTHTISVNAGGVKDKAGNGIAAVASLDGFAVNIDGTAPSASGGAADVTAAITTHSAIVTYADTGSGVDASSIGIDDLTVAGPASVTVQSASAVTNSDGSVTATYVLASPSGFTPADNGTQTISLNAGSVKDKAGNAVAGISSLDTFAVNIPQTTSRTSGFGRGGSKKSTSLQKVAVTDTTEALPTSFSAGGLYTESFSYSDTSTSTKTSAPLSTSAGTVSLFRGFRQHSQLFHA